MKQVGFAQKGLVEDCLQRCPVLSLSYSSSACMTHMCNVEQASLLSVPLMSEALAKCLLMQCYQLMGVGGRVMELMC